MKKGFTLVELVIVIVIVGILSIVAVPIYRGYVRQSMATEAKALLGTINTAQRIYYNEHADFYATGETSFCEELDVDSRSNKYFKTFAIGKDSGRWYAITSGTDAATGISATMVGALPK